MEKKKKKYVKPEIKKEPLVTFGAVCNGTTTGGRKAVTTPPARCNSARLIS
ncbi:MAG: hypothetical protein K2P81_06165 [Bacteriovoracaceae bacterium]|nr:hypothetical protein [Bacteriovoracaceae bacterium]